MTRKSLATYGCSVARTLDVIGDQWTMLIVRDAFKGVDTFTGFHKSLGISRNILTDRLESMVTNGILKKVPTSSTRSRYELTDRGKELLPMMIAIMQWGDKWIFGNSGEPLRVLDREQRAPIQQIGIIARSGQFLDLDDLLFEPGPGAEAAED